MAVSLWLLPFGVLLLGAVLYGSEPPDPRFEAQVLDDQVAIGYGLAIGDVDGDGKPDVLLADKKQIVWYRNGDWQRFVMVEDLTEHDNVCIAARDIDGDGRVEVAVGAQWNPGETTDPAQSGSVHYLLRPADPTERWEPVRLPHEPTVHRMHWVKTGAAAFSLVVLPLHGRGNEGGEGAGVKVLAYEVPDDPRGTWKTVVLDETMHLTHNFDVLAADAQADRLYVGGKEGVHVIARDGSGWRAPEAQPLPGMDGGVGEVRIGHAGERPAFLTTIEPMHGNQVAVYGLESAPARHVLDDAFAEGHALAAADLLGLGRDQIVAGWRRPNEEGKVGIKLFIPRDEAGTTWDAHWIDEGTMACEDLKVADLDGDGRLDIIASGRATNNLIVYWNRTANGE